jgi:hypothetical protein
LGFGDTGRDPEFHGTVICRNDSFQRGFAFKNCERMLLQFRFGAERGRHGKIRNVDAGEHKAVLSTQYSVVSTSSSCRPGGFGFKRH